MSKTSSPAANACTTANELSSVYEYVPSALTTRLPKLPVTATPTLATFPLTVATVNTSSRSTSTSLPNTLPVTAAVASSDTAAASSTATGGSLTPVTVTVTVA